MRRENLVICPVYNEQATIKEFFRQLRRYYVQDVLFVDDGSTDTSRDFILTLGNKNTFLIRHPERLGYGTALLSGFQFGLEGGYRRIVTIDVDLQHNPEHIPRFFRELFECEAVLGSRYIRIDKYLDIPQQRLLINRYIAGLIKEVFGIKFTDPFCGYRGYRDSFLKKANLFDTSYGLGLEILLEIIKTGTRFTEIPVEAIYLNPNRTFLDGLDDPKKRLLYYLEIISRKLRTYNEEEIFSRKPSS